METGVRLKREILRLLKEDPEFRYAVAGLIGLEEILKRLDRHGEELVRLREDMNEVLRRLDRHEEILIKHGEELVKLREVSNKHGEELVKLREDLNRGFELVNRHVMALGARWGLMSEETFREGLRGLLEREFNVRVERWTCDDKAGIVYGYPTSIEVDVTIRDGKTVLIEITSHVRPSDVAAFKRKAELYEKATGVRPDRLMMVTPYADNEAKEACLKYGIELYTKV